MKTVIRQKLSESLKSIIPLATVSSIISNAVLSTPYKEESTSGTEGQSSKKGKKIMQKPSSLSGQRLCRS